MKKFQIGRLVVEVSLKFRVVPKRRLGDYATCKKCGNECIWFVPGYQIGRAINPPLTNWILMDHVDGEGHGCHVCYPAVSRRC